MDLVVLLGRNIRACREARGLTQEQLAFEAGMKRSYVSELERGLRNPTVRALERLADALEISPAHLIAPHASGQLGDKEVNCNLKDGT